MKKLILLMLGISLLSIAQQVAIIKGTVRPDSPGAGEMASHADRIRSTLSALGIQTVIILMSRDQLRPALTVTV